MPRYVAKRGCFYEEINERVQSDNTCVLSDIASPSPANLCVVAQGKVRVKRTSDELDNLIVSKRQYF